MNSLKKGRITEPTIILPTTPGAPAEGGSDETVLDLDIGQETAPVPAQKPEDAGDDLLVKSEEVGVESEETFLDEDTDTGTTTEPLKLADEAEADETVLAEAVTEEPPAPVAARPRRKAHAVSIAAAGIPAAVEEEIERKRPHWIWTTFIIVTFAVTAYGALIFYDSMRMEAGKSEQPSGMTAGLARWFLDQFWKDDVWKKFHEDKYPDGKKPPFIDEKDGRIRHREYEGPTVQEPFRPVPPGAETAPVPPTEEAK